MSVLINITLPDPFLTIERWDLPNKRWDIEIAYHNRGIYVFHDDIGTPLYVGKSRRLYERLRSHVIGRGTSERFSDHIAKITLYPVMGLSELDIYESYAINTIKPVFNRDKVYYSGPYKTYLLHRSEELDGLIDLKRDVVDDLCARRDDPGETFAEADPEVTQDYELLSYGNLLYLNREIEREKGELRKLLTEKGVIDAKLDQMTLTNW